MTTPNETKPAPKRRGRKPGQGLGVKTGPHVGSRPWALLRLAPGESMFLEASNGVTRLMQQVATDLHRNGLQGVMTQTHLLAIQPTTREVVDIVRITRHPE